jgi:transposase-like protein
MPVPHPPEFRRRAVELARERAKPLAQIARDLQISESGLAKWVKQADIEDGARAGVTAAERKEMAAMRREIRRLEMENEILRRAAALFAKENVLPK